MHAPQPSWGRAIELPPAAGEVAIAGVGEADHSKASGRGAEEIAAQAIARALEDAGLSPRDVDGLCYSGGMGASFDAAAFHRHFGTAHEIWESPRGGGMVWAATAPALAAERLRTGKSRHVVNVFAVSWAIHRLSVSFALRGVKSGSRTQPFISAKRAAFQSLVAKFR